MIKTKLLTLSYMVLSTLGCTQNESFDDMAKKMADDKVPLAYPADVEAGSIVLLDTRTKEEFKVSHIPGAIWVGYNDFDLSSVSEFNKSAKVIVYCSVGYRSGKIGKKLQSAGFSDVKNLYGGIFHWVNTDHTVENADGEATEQVHAYNKRWSKWLEKGEKTW